MTTHSQLPSFFISHGGGPWSYMHGEFRNKYKQLEASLQQIPLLLNEKPNAVLIVSAHWQTKETTVSSHPHPGMLYDYGGFPDETYTVTYPAPGSPSLARQIQALVNASGIVCHLDENRGFDHGTFVPMSVIYPAADIPVVQISIQINCDPERHIALGRALASLRSEGILIIGSGLSYHNLRNFGPDARESSKEFDHWLQDTLCHSSSDDRTSQLVHWEQAPSARLAHPQEDHLLPLLVAVGAAEEEPASCIYHEDDFFGGISVSGFRFGL